MQSSSRRAFLMARRPPASPWEAFCQRLERLVSGRFEALAHVQGHGRARLIAEKATDLHHAQALCAEYGVVLALDGPMVREPDDRPVLWVDAGNGLASFERLEPGSASWFVQPGVMVGELEAVGFTQFATLSPCLTVAEWLADRQYWPHATGTLADSGLLFASVLLGDGTQAGLGPFGEANTRPLKGLRVQNLVSSLFRLVMDDDADACLAVGHWPARFRVDTLRPVGGRGVNLANLMAGHGGALGWLEWLVMQPVQGPEVIASMPGTLPGDLQPEIVALEAPAKRLDAAVKTLFDPEGRFPD